MDVSASSILANLGGFVLGAPLGAFLAVRWVKSRFDLTPKPPTHKETP